MNGRKRFLTALTGGTPDQVPLFELEYNPESVLGMAKVLFGDAPSFPSPVDCTPEEAEQFLKVMFDIVSELDIDAYSYVYTGRLSRLPSSPDHFSDEFGVVYQESSHGDPLPVKGPIAESSDIPVFRSNLPDSWKLPYFSFIREEIPDRALVFTVPGPFKLSWMLTGSMEKVLLAYGMDQGFITELNRLATDIAAALIDAAADQGADAVLVDGDLAFKSGTLISPEDYRRLLKPRHAELVQTARKAGLRVFKHTDGNFWPILQDFLDVGFDGVHPIQPDCMDIREVKERVRGRMCILGNIDCVKLLTSGTEEEVEQAVREAIQDLAPGGGYVLSSSNSIHPGCRPENVIAMHRAAKACGKTPA